MRVLALVLIVRAVGIVPGTLIERELVFARRAKGELGGAFVQAAVAIPLAVSGFGVWSLVAGQLAAQTVQAATFWVVTPLRPSPRLFNLRILRELGRYGRHLTAANIVYFIDQNVDTATVGALLRTADVGYYNMAWRLSNLPATGIGYIVGRVMFPVYATIQHDRPAFRAAFLSNVRRVALVSLPVGVGILLAADPIVVGIFGECGSRLSHRFRSSLSFGVIRAFTGTATPVLQAAGKPQLVLILGVWHLAVLCAGLFALTPWFGLNGAAAAVTLASAATLAPALWLAMRALELPLRELLKNVARPAACSIPLAVCLLAVRMPTDHLTAGMQLLLLVISGITVYAGSALVLARDEAHAITTAFRSP